MAQSWTTLELLVVTIIATGGVLLVTRNFPDNFMRWKNRETAATIMEDAEMPEHPFPTKEEAGSPEVLKITDNIYVATNYGLANSIWLTGDGGVVVVDTMESVEAARDVLYAMRQIIDDPVRGIIYTHSHADHTFGAEVFIEGQDEMPEIWAHKTFEFGLSEFATPNVGTMKRAMRQFGAYLPKHSYGIGNTGLLLNTEGYHVGIVMPNRLLVEDEEDILIADIFMKLVYIPGETEDQIGVWLPEARAFLCGDDIYRAFPNLYAIRGVPNRNAVKWISSLDTIRNLRPKYLIPSHGRPIVGEDDIYNLLTIYRDALQYVHDQTVRKINQGWYPEDIALSIKLPEVYKSEPYLYELYGTVEWSVRSVFDQYMGWFSGNVADLAAMGTVERAEEMVALVGGEDNLAKSAKEALQAGKTRWALQLASHVIAVNKKHELAQEIRLLAIKGLAKKSTSTNGHHYYMTTALEDHDLVNNVLSPLTKSEVINHYTIKQLFVALQCRLMSELTVGVDTKTCFHFTDLEQTWHGHLRRGIFDVSSHAEDAELSCDLKLTTTSAVWRSILGGTMTHARAYMRGDIVLEGGVGEFKKFFSYFDQDD